MVPILLSTIPYAWTSSITASVGVWPLVRSTNFVAAVSGLTTPCTAKIVFRFPLRPPRKHGLEVRSRTQVTELDDPAGGAMKNNAGPSRGVVLFVGVITALDRRLSPEHAGCRARADRPSVRPLQPAHAVQADVGATIFSEDVYPPREKRRFPPRCTISRLRSVVTRQCARSTSDKR
jgi:hypothetical protein